MKKAFMEPELKVTQFDYEEMICSGVGIDPGPGVPDTGEEFPDW